jgi:DNA-binding SARP family transcriptional activator
MRLYAISGDRANAFRVYHTCATILQRELAVGLRPSLPTQAAYDRPLRAEMPPAPSLPSSAELAINPRVRKETISRTDWSENHPEPVEG